MYKSRPVEIVCVGLLFAWGIGILRPEIMFARPAYQYMAAIMNETAWGMTAMGIAACRLTALAINGWYFRTPAIRCLFSILSGSCWITISFLMWAASRNLAAEVPAGITYYPVYLAAEIWCVFHTARDMQVKKSLAWG